MRSTWLAVQILCGCRHRWRLHDGNDHKVRGAPDGGVGGGGRSGGGGGGGGRGCHRQAATHQGAQASGAEEQLCGRLLVEVEVPLIPALEGERRHQVAVIRQAAHGLPGQSGDIAAERAHHSIWRRLTQVQDLSEALGAKTMAALEHLRPATPQVVGTVADLTLQLLCAQYVQMATTASTIVRALQINHHPYPEI